MAPEKISPEVETARKNFWSRKIGPEEFLFIYFWSNSVFRLISEKSNFSKLVGGGGFLFVELVNISITKI